MLNSLRLAGNSAAAYVVDVGLTATERERLSTTADILTLPPGYRSLHPLFAKLTPDLFWTDGIVVLLDSDMVVTASFDDLVEHAKAGKIAAHPDHPFTKDRDYAGMAAAFGYGEPQVRHPSINTAPLAVSLERWPGFFARWRSACERLPPEWPTLGFEPLGLADQDALNVMMGAEASADAVWVGRATRTVHADQLGHVEVLDRRALTCRYRGESPVVLHYGLSPKAWERRGWRRIRSSDAYVRLLRRVLFEPDVPVPLDPRETPVWLRPRFGGVAARVLDVVNYVRIDLRTRGMHMKRRLLRQQAPR